MVGVKAGELKYLVAILEPHNSSDKVGPVVTTYVEVATANAAIGEVRYLKQAIYRSIGTQASIEARMRYKPWLTNKHRIKYQGRYYIISSLTSSRVDDVTELLLTEVVEK